MKKNKLITYSIAALFLAISIGACKKYDEGPFLSLRSQKERISNTWVFQSIELNGVDSTMYYAVQGTKLVMDKEGNASGTQIRTNGIANDTTNFDGHWELHEKNTIFALILTDLATNEIDTNWWEIKKLKEDEFWLWDEDSSGDTEYLKLIPK